MEIALVYCFTLLLILLEVVMFNMCFNSCANLIDVLYVWYVLICQFKIWL